MDPGLETAGAVVLGVAGICFARWLSLSPKRHWLGAWLVSLGVVLLYGAPRYIRGLEFVPPFSWVAANRVQFVLFPLIIPALLLTPAAKLRGTRVRALLAVLAGLALLKFSVFPALFPALNHNLLLHLKTKIDRDGVCLQGTGYTCGPAAAVTALRQLGLPAEEGEIAVWAEPPPWPEPRPMFWPKRCGTISAFKASPRGCDLQNVPRTETSRFDHRCCQI